MTSKILRPIPTAGKHTKTKTLNDMKNLTLIFASTLLFSALTVCAQKQTYDLVSYTLPKGWQKQQVDGGVQLFITDNKTGGYAIAIVTKAIATTGSAQGDFGSQWKSLLVNTVNSMTNPVMTKPVFDNGWEILSGKGNYVDGNIKGLATLITSTGYNKTVATVLMTNTNQYQKELQSFINSLALVKPSSNTTINNSSSTMSSQTASHSKVVGIWGSYLNETSGTFSNGMPMTTGGHFRKEYYFNVNGTYRFIETSASAYSSNMILMYETGTWSTNGNQLTLNPTKGKNETWSKVKAYLRWNKLLKTDKRTLEKVVYTFDFDIFGGIENLVLQNNRQTVRDGTHNTNNLYQNTWFYRHPTDPNKSSLELPAKKRIE